MNSVRLYMFQTGWLRQKQVDIRLGASQEELVIPVPWFLVTHPEGNVVIDGGVAVEAARDARGHWGSVADTCWPLMEPDDGCAEQLQRHGLKAEDVRYVLQSHLHLDHTGALGHFPNATHIVQRKEYEYARAPDWFAAGGYIRKDIEKPGTKWLFLEGDSTDDFDLYGDGAIKAIFTPGHSPGHQSFLVTLADTGAILLTIDAAYTMDHWNETALPGIMTSATDVARSVKKLRAIADKTGAMVVTGHDPDLWPSFRKAPQSYE
ncbi:MAG: N-acyl homoserine lactonase family protein [Rhizobiaceae bacterium]|nr:N-acyl homoserine lactonase family protein [Rhizobiaceae bacterium]